MCLVEGCVCLECLVMCVPSVSHGLSPLSSMKSMHWRNTVGSSMLSEPSLLLSMAVSRGTPNTMLSPNGVAKLKSNEGTILWHNVLITSIRKQINKVRKIRGKGSVMEEGEIWRERGRREGRRRRGEGEGEGEGRGRERGRRRRRGGERERERERKRCGGRSVVHIWRERERGRDKGRDLGAISGTK